jgi:hypothetical protein
MALTLPRTYQAPMKAVKARKMKLKACEIIERGEKNQLGNHTQNITKYEKNIATIHLRGRDFSGILW